MLINLFERDNTTSLSLMLALYYHNLSTHFYYKKDGCIYSAYKRFCLRLHMSIYLFIFFISYKLQKKYTTHYGHERDCVFIVSNDGPILCEECTLYPSFMLKRFRRNIACLKSFQKYRNCFLMPIALPSLHFTLKF